VWYDLRAKAPYLLFFLLLSLQLVPASAGNETNSTLPSPIEKTKGYWYEFKQAFNTTAAWYSLHNIAHGTIIVLMGMRDFLSIVFDAIFYAKTGRRMSPEARTFLASAISFGILWFLYLRHLEEFPFFKQIALFLILLFLYYLPDLIPKLVEAMAK